MKTIPRLLSPKRVLKYNSWAKLKKNVVVVINACVRVVIDGEVFFMGCLNIYMKYIYFRVDIRENRKNSKKLKKNLHIIMYL